MHTEPELWPMKKTRDEGTSALSLSTSEGEVDEEVSLWGSPICSFTKGTQKDSRALCGSGKFSQITCKRRKLD